jgi:hypothetical protein
VQPLLVLLTFRAVSVLVAPGPEDGCPSARQVSSALAARVPATLGKLAGDPETVLSVVLPAPGSAQEPSFSLVDQQGRLRLFRTLARPGSGQARDCTALSDTVALIVQRYLEEVELPEIETPAKEPLPEKRRPVEPPRPPPAAAVAPPSPHAGTNARWDLSLGFAARFANQNSGLESLDLGRFTVARTLGSRADDGAILALWAGVSGWTGWSAPANSDGGQGRLVRIPSGLALMWRHSVSTLELQWGVAGLVDCWILGARYQDQLRWETRFTVAGATTGGLQVPVSKSLFVRLGLEFAVAGTRYRYVDPTHGSDATFTTPSFFASAGVALGMSLR